VEADEVYTVVLSAPVNATIADGTGVGTIINDDAGNGSLSIAAASVVYCIRVTPPEYFVVSRSPAQPVPVSVNFTTVDGTATVADNDYLPLSGTLVFGPGETTQVVSVSVVGDLQVEADEVYTVVLSAPVNATIADDTGVGTIINDDAAGNGNLSIADVTVTEGDSGLTPADFVVTLSPPQAVPVTVDFTTVDGSATVANSDYLSSSGTLSFAPGETSQVISVSVVGDLKFEPDEDFSVVLSNPTNATITDDTGVGTILNDDTPTSSSKDELIHDSRETRSLGELPGKANPTYFRMLQKAHSSYEVVVDATTGDLGPNGPDLDRLAADGVTVVQSSIPATSGSSRSLRWETAAGGADVSDEFIRVQSAGCNTNCDPEDTYRIRAYETTYRMSRFNNSATQITLVVISNATNDPVTGTMYFWKATDGSLLASQAVTLQPKATVVVNTSTIPGVNGQAGSITFSNNAPFGAVTGKAVAVEPATGFTFDTPMVPRPAATHMVPRDN
jgi:hypothetical protein